MNKEFDKEQILKWYQNQAWVKTDEEIKLLGEELITFMKSKQKNKSGNMTHFFKNEKGEKYQGFFYYDTPINEKLVNHLIASEKVYYSGRKLHQGIKYKSWTFQKDKTKIKERLKIRKELSTLLKNSAKRKSLIKSTIELKLQKDTDTYLNWMFQNQRFSILAGGTDDYVIFEKNKKIALLENVCKEFNQAINELIKEEKIKVFSNGFIRTNKNFFFKVFDMDNPLFKFILN